MPAPVPANSPSDLESLKRRMGRLEHNQRLIAEFIDATAQLLPPIVDVVEKLQQIGRES